jgi:DNA-3-methyladenine glycosylase
MATLSPHLPLSADFFARPTLSVAADLLSCTLCRQLGNEIICHQILETEAYDGPDDKASHAHRGETPRASVMFGPPGVWYVYLCYGVHWLLNIVTGPESYPAAVLIRGVAGTSGPGRLTRQLNVNGAHNRLPATPEHGLWIAKGAELDPSCIQRTPRIGVGYAGPDWANRPYRFVRLTN